MEERLKYLLKIALIYHVSDIHFEFNTLNNEIVSIGMRVQDEIKTIKKDSNDTYLFRYLMYLSNLDMSNLSKPQTGNFTINIDNNLLSLRFAVISTIRNINGVLRILNNNLDLRIDKLTCFEDDIHWLSSIKKNKDGLFIFSGPTCSGKTTTLYTILNEIHNKKIFTLEDPIEIYNKNFIQLQINEKQGFTYAAGIKQLMRHDPDIVMIGEIRDEEAANMAVRCALTGHLVVTSIHSSSCISTINRLIDLGVKEYQLKDILGGITTQNLFVNEIGEYTTIYEIFDRKDIKLYFDEHITNKEHLSLQDKIRLAKEEGYI